VGEGDDMFFVDGESLPSSMAPVPKTISRRVGFRLTFIRVRLDGRSRQGEEHAGSRSSVYRFHLDSPIPFTKSLAHHRTRARQCPLRQFFVAYWYQSEPTPLRPLFHQSKPAFRASIRSAPRQRSRASLTS